ncbi:flagellar hook assembly protein FlgD [Marinobacterium arenosum]|uniref:flagellar hook assembly protein FlgD n=1 Tax=Marinobacterium arenosum TaxID=2862496 RepID=UPI001C9855FE|nr:flagellar hook capping FlgD N-terminal domain-containing protein [Marinobacterium arenosum]MBY4675920.1 flagellar biosynthesis protein FlgD [Marinobacterium arenosum]
MAVNGINSSQNVYEQINQREQANSTQKTENADNEMFMELLIAQLKNQDPTAPTDTNAFMQQISSMSMVESMNNLNSNMESFTGSMLSSQQALQASSMVGKSVYVESNTVPIGQNGANAWAEGYAVLDEATENLRVKVYDSSGSLITTADMGAQDKGEAPFYWQSPMVDSDQPVDPSDPDGDKIQVVQYPPGEYKFVAQVPDEDGVYKDVAVAMNMPVNSVSLNGSGVGMELNTPAGSYKMSEIVKVGA